jgi:hypothetical protein
VDFEFELIGARSKGNSKQMSTDRLGLAALLLKPIDVTMGIRVAGSRRVTDPDSTGDDPADAGAPENPTKAAKLEPLVVYSGISASVHNPIVTTGEPVKVSADQISSLGPVYADLFHRGRWVQAASSYFNQGKATLEIEPVADGLNRIQLTTSALAPGRAVAVRHFYRLSKNETATDALKSILRLLESSPHNRDWIAPVLAMPLMTGAGYDRRLAAAFAFSRLYKGHQRIERLIYSRQEDDRELGEFKSKFQRTIMIVILCLGLCVALLIAMTAVKAHQRQTRISSMFADEGDDGDLEMDQRTTIGARGERVGMLVQGAVVFLVIIGAFIAIALFVDTMTWNQ